MIARLFWCLLFSLALGAAPDSLDRCRALAQLKLKDTAITSTEVVAAGSLTLPGAAEAIAFYKKLPEFCRVTGAIKPSADSDIEFEVWLPTNGWNGKFEGVGNGGFAGSISYGPPGGLAEALYRGFATASTDTGHRGNAVDAKWALGHPEKVVDYGYRGMHLMTAAAKSIVRTYYGSDAKHAYFFGCSNGGRQGLMEAQRFPADYDGIIAGAPANFITHLLDEFVWNSQALLNDPASSIPPEKLPAIEAAVLAACDGLDGAKDGLIDNPMRCRLNTSRLLCKGPESASCLTQPQITALNKIYAGPRDSVGRQIFPGDLPGAETGAGGWAGWITGSPSQKSAQFLFAQGFFADMVFNNPDWDFRTFQFDRDLKLNDEKMAPIMNATDPDL